jgi:flagellar motor switch protein FliM
VRSLSFPITPAQRTAQGKRLRRVCFEMRSYLPISAACVVANGVRETLSSLLSVAVSLRLFEPTIPSPQAWRTILHDARLYRVRGNVADAAIVLRESDAVALVAVLFGESEAARDVRALSRIERDVLDRMVNAVAANLGAVCGARDGHLVERVTTIDGFVTFFELFVEEPVRARIGVALSRDPSPETAASIEIAHLAAVKLAVSGSLELRTIEAGAVAGLHVGSFVPVAAAELRRCALMAHGRQFARGSCGVRNGRLAISVDATREAL